MALVFKTLGRKEIEKLAENPNPEEELSELSLAETAILLERIDRLAKDNPNDAKLFGKLMRLKTFAVLTEDTLRAAVGPGW